MDEPELELNESDIDEDDADESENEQPVSPRLRRKRLSQTITLFMFSHLTLLERGVAKVMRSRFINTALIGHAKFLEGLHSLLKISLFRKIKTVYSDS